MKSKTILAAAVAGLCWSLSASALEPVIGSDLPMNDNETYPAIGTIHSLDARTGGYKGWGPMANPQTPYSPNEGSVPTFAEEMQAQKQQLAEVRQARDQVWVANAPLRSEYENIGATRSRGGGFGGFFHRDSK